MDAQGGNLCPVVITFLYEGGDGYLYVKAHGFEVGVWAKQRSFGVRQPQVLSEKGGPRRMEGELSSVEGPTEVGA